MCASRSFLGPIFTLLTLAMMGCSPKPVLPEPLPEVLVTTRLHPGEAIHREAPVQDFHIYKFDVQKDMLITLILEQQGADLELLLTDPLGELLFRMDSYNYNMGLERIDWVATESGDYIAEVSNNNPDIQGAYQLQLSAFKAPQQDDYLRIEASRKPSEVDERHHVETKLDILHQAIDLRRRLLDCEDEALLSWQIADTLTMESQHEKGIAYLLDALEIYKGLDVPWREEMLGNLHQTLGAFYRHSGTYEKALSHTSIALEYHTNPNLARAESLIEKGFYLGLTGSVQNSHLYFDEALEILDHLPNSIMERRLLTQKAQAYTIQGEPGRALQTHRRAFDIQSAAELEPDTTLLDRYAKALLASEQYDQALAVLQEARDLSQNQRDLHILDTNSAEVLIELKAYKQALDLLTPALAYFTEYDDFENQAYVSFLQALALNGQGKLDQALPKMAHCRQFYQASQRNTKSPSLRASYTAARHQYLDLHIDLLMEAGQHQSAFVEAEAARARNLLARIQNEQSADPKINSLKNKISVLAWQLSQESEPVRSKQQSLDHLLRLYDEARDQTREAVGERSDAPLPTPPSLTEIQEIIDNQTTVLYYALGYQSAWLWRVERDSLTPFKLGPRAILEDRADDFYYAISHRDAVRFRERVAETGAALYQILLPEGVLSQQNKRLVVVSDGQLLYIPFAALNPTPESSPLVTKYEISYLHSLSVLRALRMRKPRSFENDVTIFADPVYGNQSPYYDLPYTAVEAREIERLAPRSASMNIGMDASKSRFLEDDKRSAVLHLAAHGMVFPNRGELSALLLSDTNQQGQAIDGYVRAHEIAAMPVNADLVVLSSCRSALGQDIRGEGLVGLPQSFLEAGARGVLVSLWDLEDKSTAQFMGFFYTGLFGQGLNPSQALQQAQISMMEQTQDAFYWSAFQYFGDWNIRFDK